MNKNELILEVIKLYQAHISWVNHSTRGATTLENIIYELIEQTNIKGDE